MQRRTVLRWIAALGSAVPFSGLRAWAQTAAFPANQSDVLEALADVVLPSEIGAARIREVVQRFAVYVRDYRAGAEMDHGYGVTRLRNKPASPASTYMRQLESLRPSLLTGDAASRKRAIEDALHQAQLTDLPRTPDGRHVVTDLMSFYFRGSEANDLCYRAQIGRDLCRGLKGSDNPPAELK